MKPTFSRTAVKLGKASLDVADMSDRDLVAFEDKNERYFAIRLARFSKGAKTDKPRRKAEGQWVAITLTDEEALKLFTQKDWYVTGDRIDIGGTLPDADDQNPSFDVVVDLTGNGDAVDQLFWNQMPLWLQRRLNTDGRQASRRGALLKRKIANRRTAELLTIDFTTADSIVSTLADASERADEGKVQALLRALKNNRANGEDVLKAFGEWELEYLADFGSKSVADVYLYNSDDNALSLSEEAADKALDFILDEVKVGGSDDEEEGGEDTGEAPDDEASGDVAKMPGVSDGMMMAKRRQNRAGKQRRKADAPTEKAIPPNASAQVEDADWQVVRGTIDLMITPDWQNTDGIFSYWDKRNRVWYAWWTGDGKVTGYTTDEKGRLGHRRKAEDETPANQPDKTYAPSDALETLTLPEFNDRAAEYAFKVQGFGSFTDKWGRSWDYVQDGTGNRIYFTRDDKKAVEAKRKKTAYPSEAEQMVQRLNELPQREYQKLGWWSDIVGDYNYDVDATRAANPSGEVYTVIFPDGAKAIRDKATDKWSVTASKKRKADEAAVPVFTIGQDVILNSTPGQTFDIPLGSKGTVEDGDGTNYLVSFEQGPRWVGAYWLAVPSEDKAPESQTQQDVMQTDLTETFEQPTDVEESEEVEPEETVASRLKQSVKTEVAKRQARAKTDLKPLIDAGVVTSREHHAALLSTLTGLSDNQYKTMIDTLKAKAPTATKVAKVAASQTQEDNEYQAPLVTATRHDGDRDGLGLKFTVKGGGGRLLK